MAKFSLAKNTTSRIVQMFIQDSSATTGAGLTGLLYNAASLTAYYQRENAASPVAITLATMTVGTWASGGFKEVSSANMPGVYQLGLPDAALASGAASVVVMLKGAASMAPVTLEIDLEGAALQTPVKRNTALNNFTFLMVDSSTGQPKVGLTVTAERSLDGAPFAACANAPVEIAYGVYKINLAATDLNAVDVCLRFSALNARDSILTILTIP
jgi:hypothetical protein